jgi:hypothetical protein
MLNRAEGRSLPHIHELIDRLDGKASQTIEYDNAPIRELTDSQLHQIAGRGLAEKYQELKALPAPRKFSG